MLSHQPIPPRWSLATSETPQAITGALFAALGAEPRGSGR